MRSTRPRALLESAGLLMGSSLSVYRRVVPGLGQRADRAAPGLCTCARPGAAHPGRSAATGGAVVAGPVHISLGGDALLANLLGDLLVVLLTVLGEAHPLDRHGLLGDHRALLGEGHFVLF